MNTKKISILGAGLVGSLLGLLLRKKEYEVEIFERRPDMRNANISAGKSINLAMSQRGWKALEYAGLKNKIEEIALPMFGRCIHHLDGSTSFQMYGKNNEAIYSVSRGELNKLLMTEAENLGCKIHFNQKCDFVNVAENKFNITDENGIKSEIETSFLCGADGAFSSLRQAYTSLDRTNYFQEYIDHGYKELLINPNEEGSFKMRHDALHIWPRKNFMLIALPNIDGTFTVTIFLPYTGPNSFEELNTDDKILNFFKTQFPDAVAILDNLLDTFKSNPTSSLVTIRTNPWVYKDKSFLIGDAAHAIVPFYGQGMNAGFEDCSFVFENIDKYEDKTQFLLDYEKSRKPNGDAVLELALRNFIEMRDWVAEPKFLERKEIEKQLGLLYPNLFNSVYEMVSFSNNAYTDALKCIKAQDELLENIMSLGNFDDTLKFSKDKLDKLLEEYSLKINL